MKNLLFVRYVKYCKTIIGEHCMVVFDLICKLVFPPPEILLKRCWKNYSKDLLRSEIGKINFNKDADDPQSYRNKFEQKLLTVTYNLVPYAQFSNNQTLNSVRTFTGIKANLRKKLLIINQSSPSNDLRIRLKNLNKC